MMGESLGGAASRLIGCLPLGLPYKESRKRERGRRRGGGGEREDARAMFGMEGWME